MLVRFTKSLIPNVFFNTDSIKSFTPLYWDYPNAPDYFTVLSPDDESLKLLVDEKGKKHLIDLWLQDKINGGQVDELGQLQPIVTDKVFWDFLRKGHWDSIERMLKRYGCSLSKQTACIRIVYHGHFNTDRYDHYEADSTSCRIHFLSLEDCIEAVKSLKEIMGYKEI